MSFFNSEVVQDQLQSIYDTYSELAKTSDSISELPKDEARKHIKKTKALIEKQKLFYVRLQLSASTDEDAADMRNRIDLISQMFGHPTLLECLGGMDKYLDKVLEDLDTRA